ncbi:hypothetical protein BVG16_24405 [Paenibacillus selenitireducens]|uniref:N-acetyltransferase domain-containing protein n=1 Tax=Paenibacillus selenitireducens TaxID=1324314 RepID=A0A1T2X337_9BACL|nr:GNAT family N-acetyltransferase [Paenibacillus selenitireducens]OPA74272.1 hypothetical protein BVG16_24405 [Paenibacillus selenitireducens]
MGEIRFVDREHIEEAAVLADSIFRKEGQPSMAEEFPAIFSGHYECSVGYYAEGKLVSFIGVVPSLIQVGSATLPLFSIGSVCTHPDHQGKGYAGALLQRVFEHIEASGGSLLYVSGDRSLYIRNGCAHFGSFRSYAFTPEVMQSLTCEDARITIREAAESDRFRLQAWSDSNEVRYQRSLYETSVLVRASALASLSLLEQKVYIVESERQPVAYFILGVPSELGSKENPFVIEYGGTVNAMVQGLAIAFHRHKLSTLRMHVSWHETDLFEVLREVPSTESQNEGTIKIVNPARLWEQLTPYLLAKDDAAARQVHIRNVDGQAGAADVLMNGKLLRLDSQALISLLFNAEPKLSEEILEHSEYRALFPIPLPYAGGLHFI